MLQSFFGHFSWQRGGVPVLTCVMCSLAGLGADVPETARRPVADVYHGVRVVDDYRWLEDASNTEVKAWVAQQNAYTQSFLGKYKGRDAVAQELLDFFKKRSTVYSAVTVRAGKVFALKRLPAQQQPSLILFASTRMQPAEEKTVLDPLVLDKTGSTTIDWFVPSTSARYIAVSLSKGGSEHGDVHVYETASGKELAGDMVPRAQNGTGGGSAAWNRDDTGFVYTRYPSPGERAESDLAFYQQIYFHRLGEAADKDRYELGRDFPRIAETTFEPSADGRGVLATVANGDGGEYKHYVRAEDGAWHPVTQYADQVTTAHFGEDGSLYLLSKKSAPLGKLLRVSKGAWEAKEAQQVVAESDAAIDDFQAGTKSIFVAYLAGGPSEIRVFSTNGQGQKRVPLPAVVAVDNLKLLGPDELLFVERGYTEISTWRTYSAASGQVRKVETISPEPAIRFEDAEVTREFATSKDGTRVPLNIIRKKGTALDGNHALVLTGYGGYGISERPGAGPFTRLLLDHDVIYVTTNLRGGGEYGEKWHQEGNLTRKQNVFDDFYACAKFLVDHKYTSPDRLAIIGGSNGGLLMGAALTQHPEMYRAVASFVGIYDMLRVELSPNGAFNVTEFGTVKEGDQFRALYAYSPYHHVENGTVYPATIFLTGDNDPRVDPANSRKMVARLQAAGPGKGPFLLRTSSNAGHGIGSSLSETVSQFTDAFTFLFSQLGVD